MLFADFCAISQYLLTIQGCAISASLRLNGIERINMFCNFFNKSTAANKLMNLKWASTVRTLLSLFNQPLSHAILAAQLATAWANDSIFDLAETNEAFEQLFDVLIRCSFLLFSLLPMLMS